MSAVLVGHLVDSRWWSRELSPGVIPSGPRGIVGLGQMFIRLTTREWRHYCSLLRCRLMPRPSAIYALCLKVIHPTPGAH